ncbi:MAG: PilZ domain-containing protein [Lachnospiraceae bacterium]|nr:PilZ domain-containing protein [Lachnospiraceae bacterium]
MYLHEIPEGISLYITDAGSQSQGGSQWTVLTTPTLKLPEKELQMAAMLCKKLHYRSFGVVQFLDNENHAYHADHGKIYSTYTEINHKHYTWKPVRIMEVKVPSMGHICLLFSDDNPIAENRRSEIRLTLQCPVDCLLNGRPIIEGAILQDISMHGFSIVLMNNMTTLRENDIIHISFGTEIYNMKTKRWDRIQEELQGRVTHIDAKKQPYIVHVGCRIREDNTKLKEMVYASQMNYLRLPEKMDDSEVLV